MNIAHALEELDLGFAQTFRNLTVVPLVRRSRAGGEDEAPPYLTLDEAIARELLFIRELPGAASVPELQAENRGDLPVLLVDGDQLVGAKQNRIINLTILVPPGKTIVIPVSCVEAGRWRFTSDRFRPAEHTLYAQAKAEKLRHVSASLEASGRATSDQGAVWDSIREKIASMDAAAPTEAMADIYKRHEASVEEYARAFHPVPGQVGAVFAINGYVAGLELFSHTPMFVAHFLKTLRGFGLDAVDAAGNGTGPRTGVRRARSSIRWRTRRHVRADVPRRRTRRDRPHRQRRRDWRGVGGGGKGRACDGVPEELRQRGQPCLSATIRSSFRLKETNRYERHHRDSPVQGRRTLGV